jgi:hypothetical protein
MRTAATRRLFKCSHLSLISPSTASFPFNSYSNHHFQLFMSATAARSDPFKPARRVAGQRQDVWQVVDFFSLVVVLTRILKDYRERSSGRIAGPAHCEHGPGLFWIQPASIRT